MNTNNEFLRLTHWTQSGWEKFRGDLNRALGMNRVNAEVTGDGSKNPRDFDGKPLRPVNGVDIQTRGNFRVDKVLGDLSERGAVVYSEAPNPPSGESVE